MSALSDTLELGRSLRPFKRHVPSRTQVILDEAATAHRIADTGDWTPVLRPAPERWLDMVLVVEESSSMIIWQRAVAELQRLLERLGAFRHVEVLHARAAGDDLKVELYSRLGARPDQRRLHRPSELVDPPGRRLIAVVSDCVSTVWHNGVMATLLHTWGRVGMAAVVQVLPHSLWVRTGLRTFPRAFVRSPAPGASNSTFEVEFPGYRPRSGLSGSVAVPTVSLDPVSLGQWARAVAGNSSLWIPGAVATPTVPGHAPSTPSQDRKSRRSTTASAEQLVRVFYGTASPTARHLATVLAAVPLTLPVVRLVQKALLPRSGPVHLAEFWLSGLVDRTPASEGTTRTEDVEYPFVAGVRELLLANLRLGDAIDALSAVSGYVGERIGQPLDFHALIADPTATGDVRIADGNKSFARVAAGALRRFGGPYAEVAHRLESSLYGAASEPAVARPPVPVETSRGNGSGPRPTKDRVRVAALLVGIEEHARTDIPRLAGPGNDVRLSRHWLRSSFGLEDDHIVTLTNEQATRQGIIDAWRQSASRLDEGDQFFFHFSGNDQQIPSMDPNEADGLDETLLAYDSVPGDRATLLTHQDLVDLAIEVEARGAQPILFLDSCHMASGLFARRALPNTLVFAACAEMEVAYENVREAAGAASSSLAEALNAYREEMTWADVYDQVLARLRSSNYDQTPQLIGSGDGMIFGSGRRAAPPYLLVTRVGQREIEVEAPAALFPLTGDGDPVLLIHQPGSAFADVPIGLARVTRLTPTGIAAAVETSTTIPLASRAKLVQVSDAPPVLRVVMGAELGAKVEASPLFRVEPPSSDRYDVEASHRGAVLALRDRRGREVWRGDLDPEAGTAEAGAQLHSVLEHLCSWVKTARLANAHAASDLAGGVGLDILSADASAEVTLVAGQSLTCRVWNRTSENVYVSVWMLDDHLGVERVYPATTSCVLLGRNREVSLAVALHPPADTGRPSTLTFKVFASRRPNDLGLLALPRLDRPFELSQLLGDITAEPQRDAEPGLSTPTHETRRGQDSKEAGPWVTGGPVAVTSKLWTNGMTLRVKFLNGDLELQRRVMDVAREWTADANLTLMVVQEGPAELRVAFGDVSSWAYMGTDGASVPDSEPTINLGTLVRNSLAEEVRRVVLHEFGHALGMAAANQSPIADIPWNKKAAYAYYESLGWDKGTVDQMLFQQYDRSEVTFGAPDSQSVMYHPIPGEATDGKVHIEYFDELSEGDRAFIVQLYPQPRRERLSDEDSRPA